MVWFLLLFCIHGYICGKIVNRIIEDKGRTEDWFLWAFFSGVYVIIAALLLPKVEIYINEDENYFGSDESVVAHSDTYKNFEDSKKMIAAAELSKGWNCPVCGDMNAGHVGTCSCGYSVAGNM